jgi:hypothetical protein
MVRVRNFAFPGRALCLRNLECFFEITVDGKRKGARVFQPVGATTDRNVRAPVSGALGSPVAGRVDGGRGLRGSPAVTAGFTPTEWRTPAGTAVSNGAALGSLVAGSVGTLSP